MAREQNQPNSLGTTVEERVIQGQSAASGALFWRSPMVIGGIVALVAIVGGIFIFQHMQSPNKLSSKEDSSVSLTVSTTKAKFREIDRHLEVNGSISAWDPLSIGAETSALRVETVNVEEGDRVRKGQILASLNSSVLRAQLAQLKAHLNADEASLKKAIQPNRVEDINSMRAALSASEANLAQEEANLIRLKANAANSQENARRYNELRKVGAVSQMDADTKNTDAKTSTADVSAGEKRVDAMRYALHQAKERLAMAERGGRQEDIQISKSSLEETRARLSQLEAQIEQTIIRAPSDGKIVKREVHLGEISSVGKTMFQMVRDSRFEMRALVPEVDLLRIRPGMKVTMSSMGQGVAVVGVIREVSPSVDEKTRLGMARIDLPDTAAKELKPGLFYHGDIDLGRDKALVVPSRAVLNRNDKDVVFVYDNGQAHMREVSIGEPLLDGGIEVRSGLKVDESVIVSGAGFMKDNDKVRAIEEGSATRN